MTRVAIIGFGEAGQAFAQGWKALPGVSLSAYDIKTDSKDADTAKTKWQDYETSDVTGCETLQDALQGADAIVSLVTADQANSAANVAGEHISSGSFFFDGNSCAPDTKKKSAIAIDNAGGLYVDMAIIAPVHPTLHKTPVLLSGPHVALAQTLVKELDLAAKTVDGPIGLASSIKMTRSVMMKGLEALMLECVLAGRKAGVEDLVLDSLEVTYPGFEWKKRAAYMLERVATHGIRRAAEMREVAKTVDDLDLNGTMAHATVDWHQRIGNLALDTTGFENKSYQQLADILLKELGH